MEDSGRTMSAADGERIVQLWIVVASMLVCAPADIGALIRDWGKRLKLDQSTLAKHIGRDPPACRAATGARALGASGFGQEARDEPISPSAFKSRVDINAIATRARTRKSALV